MQRATSMATQQQQRSAAHPAINETHINPTIPSTPTSPTAVVHNTNGTTLNHMPNSPFNLGALSLGAHSPRDLFHYFVNHDRNYDKIGLAKEFCDFSFAMAEEFMQQDRPEADFPSHFTYVPYSKEAVTKKVLDNYDTLWKLKYTDWVAKGMSTEADFDENVIGGGMWWASNFERLRLWLLQRAPFNLTDGAWLRQAAPTGPISDVHARLIAVYLDEIGNGDVTQNHCNCFKDVLRSVGFVVPDVLSRQFADMQGILDSAYTKPTLALAVSLYSSVFFAEVLGFTLWLEVTSAPEHAACAKILEKYNLDPTFSLLHTAIDNMDNGHARYALDSCISYVEHIKATEGDAAAENAWRRIWRGYTAYGIVGDMYPDLLQRYKEIETTSVRQRFVDLIRRKAQFGAAQHGIVRLDGVLLDKLFENPEKFERMLADSKYVEPGNPWESMFLNRLVTFHGPMYQVFNTDELNIITDWIMSLKPSIEKRMYLLISRKRFVGDRKHGNKTLPIPVSASAASSTTAAAASNSSSQSSLPASHPPVPQGASASACPFSAASRSGTTDTSAGAGAGATKYVDVPIDALFSDPIKFMHGLKIAGYCAYDKQKGTVDDCRLIRLVTGSNKQMTMAFTTEDVQTMREWIVAGCPVPETAPKVLEIRSNAQFTHKL